MYETGDYELIFGKNTEFRVNDWMIEDNSFAVANTSLWIAISLLKYVNKLKEINSSIIISGETHDALEQYICLFDNLAEKLGEIGNQYKTLCGNFLSDVDAADSYIYEKCSSKSLTRDFSTTKENDLKRSIKDDWSGPFKDIYNYLDNAVYGFAGKIQDICAKLDQSKRNSNSYLSILLNKNDASKKQVERIFKAARLLDEDYAKKYAVLYDDFKSVVDLIDEADAIVSSKETFTVASIAGLIAKCDLIAIPDYREILKKKVTAEDAEEFTSDIRNRTFYSPYMSELNNAVNDIGALDTAAMIIYQGKAIALSTVVDSYNVPDKIGRGDIFEYLVVKKQLASTIDKMAEKSKTKEEYYAQAEMILGIIEGKGKDHPEYDVFRRMYDDTVKAMEKYLGETEVTGTITSAMDISTKVADILLPMFASYIENQEIIKSLANGMDPNSLAGIAVAQLQDEYDNQFKASIDKFLAFIFSETAKEAIKQGRKTLLTLAGEGAGSLYSAIDLGIKTTGELSGLSTASSSQLEFLCLFNSNAELEKAYQHNFDIIASGTYTDDDVTNLANSFQILKETYAREYTLLGKAAGVNGDYDKKDYYDYLASNIKGMTIGTTNTNQVLSFEEFLNV